MSTESYFEGREWRRRAHLSLKYGTSEDIKVALAREPIVYRTIEDWQRIESREGDRAVPYALQSKTLGWDEQDISMAYRL